MWKDSKGVLFLDNCFSKVANVWSYTRRRTKQQDGEVTCPVAALVYNKAKSLVDAANARSADHSTDPRSKRKQNRTAFRKFETIVLNNSLIIFAESTHLWNNSDRRATDVMVRSKIDKIKLRVELFRNWRSKCINSWGSHSNHLRTKNKVNYTIDTNKVHQLVKIHTKYPSGRRSQMACVVCDQSQKRVLTIWHCRTCPVPQSFTAFCHPSSLRNCFEIYDKHQDCQLEYDDY